MKKIHCLLAILLIMCLFACSAEAAGMLPQYPEASEKQNPVTIEETVIYDEGGIKVTAKSLSTSGLFGPELKLLIENGSNTAVTVSSRSCSVNGYMVESLMSEDVAAGKKANTTLTLMSSELKSAGITVIAEIEFSLHIYNSDTWSTIADSEPLLIKTSAAVDYEPEFDNSGDMIFNDKDIEVVVRGLDYEDSFFGPGIVVYIANNTGRNIVVSAEDVSVNGFMVYALFSCELAPGKHAIDSIGFMSSELKENDISEIEEVELSLHIWDDDTWDTIADSKPIVIDFK